MDSYGKADPEEIVEMLKKIVEQIKKLKEEQRKHAKEFSNTYSG